MRSRTLLNYGLIPRDWVLILSATVVLLCLGCGRESSSTSLDPLNLFADQSGTTTRHHPVELIELELGEFEVAIPIEGSVDQYCIGFTAAVIVPRGSKDQLRKQLAEYQTRVRDMILVSTQNLSPNNVTDPHQSWLKSEIVAKLSRMLKTRDVRDVVFSSYNFERR